MPREGGSKWAKLPQTSVLLIIEKLVSAADNSFIAAADLRRVCKAWHAAASYYPAALHCREIEDLSKLCSTFPKLAALHLSAPAFSARQLRPLTSCNQLTSISIENPYSAWGEHPRQLGGRYLPASLRKLDLQDIMPDATSFGQLSNLEHLSSFALLGSEEHLTILLQDLSGLKVGLIVCNCLPSTHTSS